MADELPYRCEYAKSNRAGCKKCKNKIDKDDLRLAVMVRSPHFDGRTPNWFHYDCFFARSRPNGPEEIEFFENLRYEDQKRITESIAKARNGGAPSAANSKTGKGKKRKSDAVATGPVADFTVEYAKSGRSKCKLCENNIGKDEVRLGKMDYESADALQYGPICRWFHTNCFISARDELGFFWDAKDIANFDALEAADKKELSRKLKAKPSTSKPEKAVKKEEEPDPTSQKEEKALKKQSNELYKYVENLKCLRRQELLQLYEANSISKIPDDTTQRMEYIADALVFGLPQKCPTCGSCLRFKISRYICQGNVDEWTKCTYETDVPKRTALIIPEALKEAYDFLKKYKYKPGKKRVFITHLKNRLEERTKEELNALVNVKVEGDSVDSSASVSGSSAAKPLSGYKIGIIGGKQKAKSMIIANGGTVVKTLDQTVAFAVCDQNTFLTSKSKQIKNADDFKVPIVSEAVFDKLDQGIAKALVQSEISLWNMTESELEERINNLNVSEKIKSTFKSGGASDSNNKSLGKSKMVIKSGAVVDPESNLENDAHILKEGDSLYNAVLNKVDVSKNLNSFYKIQVLEDDRLNGNYWVFRSWGRIGTNRCGSKCDRFYSKQAAIEEFKQIYHQQTLNTWEDRKNFKKHPNGYYPIDVDYGELETKLNVAESKSTLPEPVKNLVSLIFDVAKMKQTMMEFELDLEKMPLGKLSKAQLLEACSTLKEISAVLNSESTNISKLTGLTNKFYSLVPHNFGNSRPDIIKTQEVIGKKMQMLESLMDIELAYDIIKNQEGAAAGEDPIDFHYKKLNAHIEPVEKNSEEYKLIAKYMKNTHAATHSGYRLEITNIFKVERNGEDLRFQKFANNENRMLLWHGSRLTNFVGILSQGLRIAPPEAPVCGYMFGKGVYFADSVSKSANYCCAHISNSDALMLLSEVALGPSLELTHSNFVTKLDHPYQSVKGVGGTHPDPKKMHVLPNGVKVPLGKMVPNKDVKNTSLLYNEYIVYNEEQIKIRYLINVKFNYDSLF